MWELLLEIEKFRHHAGEIEQGAVALVMELAKAFERVSLPIVWALATHFNLSRKMLRVLCGYYHGHLFLGQSGVVCCCVLCCGTP